LVEIPFPLDYSLFPIVFLVKIELWILITGESREGARGKDGVKRGIDSGTILKIVIADIHREEAACG